MDKIYIIEVDHIYLGLMYYVSSGPGHLGHLLSDCVDDAAHFSSLDDVCTKRHLLIADPFINRAVGKVHLWSDKPQHDC